MSLGSGLEALRMSLGEGILSTGIEGLDELLGGGVRPGLLHLLYGDRRSPVDEVLHRILVNSLLPRERGGLGGRAVYICCGNYRRERTVLRGELLARLMEGLGLNPGDALREIYVIPAFSPEQQEAAFDRARGLVEADGMVRLIAVHNISKLFTSGDARASRPRLQRLILDLWRLSAERGLALVATCRPVGPAGRGPPAPEGGSYLSHMSGVILYLRGLGGGAASALLVKHPSRAARGIEFRVDGGGPMGRITRPFRSQFRDELRRLEASFARALRDEGRREAFNRLVEAWGSEVGAMSNADLPTVLDVMILTAIVDNRRRIEELGRRLEMLRLQMGSPSERPAEDEGDGRGDEEPGMGP